MHARVRALAAAGPGTIELAHNLRLSVVAKGIEDPEAADWLRGRGCDIGQGICIAGTLPADAFIALAQQLGTGQPKESA